MRNVQLHIEKCKALATRFDGLRAKLRNQELEGREQEGEHLVQQRERNKGMTDEVEEAIREKKKEQTKAHKLESHT